jgi:hypothetical protein
MLVNLRSQLQDAVAGGSHRQYGVIAPFHTDGDEDFLQLGFLPSSLAHSTMMSLLVSVRGDSLGIFHPLDLNHPQSLSHKYLHYNINGAYYVKDEKKSFLIL